MKKKTLSEKHKFLSYFNLRDAFQQPGCAVCTLAEKDSLRYLDALLYERVNDVGTRVRLREALGFCNWHAWKALEVRNCALGLGIIYEDLLQRIADRISKVQDSIPSPSRARLLLKRFRPRKAALGHPHSRPTPCCPACQHVRFFEKIYLEVLLDFIAEADFERRFNHSSGICFPHLVEAIQNYPQHKNLPLLIKKQVEKVDFLRKEVAEFVRKQDYKYAAEPRGPEIDSWKKGAGDDCRKKRNFSKSDAFGRNQN